MHPTGTWKANLGLKLSDEDIEEYKSEINSLIEEASDYLEDKQYEATLAIKLLIGDGDVDSYTGGLDATYAGLQEQLSEVGTELQRVISESLSDGVISSDDLITYSIGGIDYKMDEAQAIADLQNKIAEITNKVSSAESDATLQSLQIRYGGAQLDSDSFTQLQAELQTEVESLTSNYDEALEVSLTSLNLQLQEGAIDQSEYDAQVQELADAYDANIEELQVRVESFQLDTISEAFDSSLEGILPDIEGTTTEKLTEAMNNALAIEPDPAEWTTDDIVGWFGLDDLSEELQTNISSLLQSTAATIPTSLKESIVEAVGTVDVSDIDFVGPYSQEIYNQLSTLNLSSADMSALKESLGTGVATAVQDADMSKVSSALDVLKSNVDTSVDNAFSTGTSTTLPVDVTLDYSVLNPTKTFTISGTGNTSGSTTMTVKANAAGGYVSGGPVLSWLAEEGYGEFVIPTAPSRRTRALSLYEQAGEALGVTAHADGGFVGSSNSANLSAGYNLFSESLSNAATGYYGLTEGNTESGTNTVSADNSSESTSVSINVTMTPQFNITTSDSADEETTMAIIRKNMKAMADELGGEIAERLEMVFSNMPLKGA